MQGNLGNDITSKNCGILHSLFNGLKIQKYPFNKEDIPLNGIYIMFEDGELSHNTRRIVRVGTHTGNNQLFSRLEQHFQENKDRSIFRKNIGRCILNKENDPFLEDWEKDLTTRDAKQTLANKIDLEKQNRVEKLVTEYMTKSFSFVVFQVDNKEKRLSLESKIISTVSLCNQCRPSKDWLGLYSPVEKIRESGLWLVNELYKKPVSNSDIDELRRML